MFDAQREQLLDGIERVRSPQADDDELLIVGDFHESGGEFGIHKVARHDRTGVFEHGGLERRDRRLARL